MSIEAGQTKEWSFIKFPEDDFLSSLPNTCRMLAISRLPPTASPSLFTTHPRDNGANKESMTWTSAINWPLTLPFQFRFCYFFPCGEVMNCEMLSCYNASAGWGFRGNGASFVIWLYVKSSLWICLNSLWVKEQIFKLITYYIFSIYFFMLVLSPVTEPIPTIKKFLNCFFIGCQSSFQFNLSVLKGLSEELMNNVKNY